MNRKPLHEWELEKGLKIKTKKRKIKYTEKDFKKAIKLNYITVKTEKGLDYLQEL